MSKKCVLAYSGGLDTSVILGWLMERGYDVHAVYVDLGRPCENRDEIRRKAENIGAASVRFIDVKEEHFPNALPPIVVRLFGIVIDSKEEQP